MACLALLQASGEEEDELEALEAFCREHVPSMVALFERHEDEGNEDEMEELIERAFELREVFQEAEGVDGATRAKVEMELVEAESALDLLEWKIDDGELDGDGVDGRIEGLEREIERLERHLGERGGDEGDYEPGLLARVLAGRRGDLQPEIPDGPVYVPAPRGAAAGAGELAEVTFDFTKHIASSLERYCFECHDSDSAKGDIDLEAALAQRPFVRNLALWENVAERLRAGDMPPEDEPQPAAEEALRLRAWVARDIEGFDYAAVRSPGYVPARRMTREEYNRTIRDLVGLDLRPADAFPMDFSGTSGFSNSANTLFLQTAHLDRYMTAADGVIDAARADPAAWSKLRGEGDAGEALLEFARRAYRRPLEPAERDELLGRQATYAGRGLAADATLAKAMKVVLVSPKFLLRVERDEGAAEGDRAVGAYDLASRLSYFLWASMPDEELLRAAAAGELADPAGRRAQVLRMLDDPRSRALGEILAGEWLGTDDVGPRIRKDPIDNPWCTESLMAAMRGETALFFHSLVLEDAPVARLLDADYTFLNEELARFYRIRGVEGEAMRRVSLESERRGGVFGHASVLAATSFPDRTSPVVRGAWILETLLGTPPPPPPPNVPEIEVDAEGARGVRTLRRRLQQHRASKACAGCHAQIDPLGFALESYAEFGQWREGVDNHGALPSGATFRGPAGLKLALLDTRLDDLGRQVTRKMLAYGLGRQLEYYDEGVVREIAAKLKPKGYPMRELVIEVAGSYPFLNKRAPATRDVAPASSPR